MAISDADIQVGRSMPDASGKWVFNASGTPANAVRVLTQRTSGSAGGAIPLFFGSLVGASTFEPQQTATASFLNVDICLVLDRSTSMKLNADSSESGMFTNDPRFCTGPLPPVVGERSTRQWQSLWRNSTGQPPTRGWAW
jgi:Ca-activated chloride channel homolog